MCYDSIQPRSSVRDLSRYDIVTPRIERHVMIKYIVRIFTLAVIACVSMLAIAPTSQAHAYKCYPYKMATAPWDKPGTSTWWWFCK